MGVAMGPSIGPSLLFKDLKNSPCFACGWLVFFLGGRQGFLIQWALIIYFGLYKPTASGSSLFSCFVVLPS